MRITSLPLLFPQVASGQQPQAAQGAAQRPLLLSYVLHVCMCCMCCTYLYVLHVVYAVYAAYVVSVVCIA